MKFKGIASQQKAKIREVLTSNQFIAVLCLIEETSVRFLKFFELCHKTPNQFRLGV
jgi:hypothetical protein